MVGGLGYITFPHCSLYHARPFPFLQVVHLSLRLQTHPVASRNASSRRGMALGMGPYRQGAPVPGGALLLAAVRRDGRPTAGRSYISSSSSSSSSSTSALASGTYNTELVHASDTDRWRPSAAAARCSSGGRRGGLDVVCRGGYLHLLHTLACDASTSDHIKPRTA